MCKRTDRRLIKLNMICSNHIKVYHIYDMLTRETSLIYRDPRVYIQL